MARAAHVIDRAHSRVQEEVPEGIDQIKRVYVSRTCLPCTVDRVGLAGHYAFHR